MSCLYAPAHAQPAIACGTPQLPAWPSRSLAALRDAFDAVHDGIAAWRYYQQLSARGVPHDVAIHEALGIDPCGGGDVVLCFVGKA